MNPFFNLVSSLDNSFVKSELLINKNRTFNSLVLQLKLNLKRSIKLLEKLKKFCIHKRFVIAMKKLKYFKIIIFAGININAISEVSPAIIYFFNFKNMISYIRFKNFDIFLLSSIELIYNFLVTFTRKFCIIDFIQGTEYFIIQ